MVFLLLLFFNLSCNNSISKNKLNGNWEFVSITPSKTTLQNEPGKIAADLWLNVLSSNSIIKFQNDSIFLNSNFLSTFSIKGDFITIKKEDKESEIYKVMLNKDTLKLISKDSDETTITMEKKSL